MNQYLSKTVVVPWDFSEMSHQALKTTLGMVDSPDRIEVVHVTSYPSAVEPGVVWGAITESTISKNLTESFEEVCSEAGYPKVKFTTVFGDPGSEVVAIAKDRDAGLIVISSHGRTGLNRMLLGSVAERVVRLAACPVLVLRSDGED